MIMHMYIYDLLEWLLGCGPVSLAMAVYQQKVQNYHCLVYEPGCLGWSSHTLEY